MFNPWRHTDDTAKLYLPGLPSLRAEHSFQIARNPFVGVTGTLANPGWSGVPGSAQPVAVAGAPSLKIVQLPGGGADVQLIRNISSGATLTTSDVEPLRKWGEDVLSAMVALSQGSMTYEEMAAEGHPYGRQQKTGELRGLSSRSGFLFDEPTIKGTRGPLPSLTVINVHSGTLLRNWRFFIETSPGKVILHWVNDAPYAWFLANGTRLMVAHGPWTYAPLASIGTGNIATLQSVQLAARRQAIDETAFQSIGAM